MSFTLPQNAWGILEVLLFVLGTSGFYWWHGRRVSKPLGEVHDQVKNNHDSNLREDVDEIRDVVIGVSKEVAELRGEFHGFMHRNEGRR